MDLNTFIGIIIIIVVIIFGIMSGADGLNPGNLINFWDTASFLIVVCTTLACIFACFPLSALKGIPKHFKIMMDKKSFDPLLCIDTIVEFAEMARKSGLLTLEEKANQQEDPFLKTGIMLVVDAIDADKIKQMLSNDLDYLCARHEQAIGIYEKGVAMGPAFGMIGTLVGLINMLAGMDLGGSGGASSLGADMSVALITTLYGSFIANVIFGPLANKLKIRHDEEMLCKEIIIEGVLSIQSGENPSYIKEKLVAFLSQKTRETALDSGE